MEKHLGQSRREENVGVHRFFSMHILLSPAPTRFFTSSSNFPCTLIILLPPALTPVFLNMHKPCPVCTNILFSLAPIPVLLCIYPQ